jgi:hypothetical protein
VNASCVAIANMFSSINMTSTTTKSMFELEGEIILISCSNETWEMWTTLCDAHNEGNLVNQQSLKIYIIEKDANALPISKELFRPLQRLKKLKLHSIHLKSMVKR